MFPEQESPSGSMHNKLFLELCQCISAPAIGVPCDLPQNMRGQVPLTQEHFLDSLRIWGGLALPSPLNAPSQCYSFLGRHWAHLCHQNFTSKSKMVLD